MRLLFINVAVLGALGLAALGALEAYLRLTVPPSSGGSIYEYSLDTKRYKTMKPNAAVTAWGEELRTNDLGFRDAAPSIPPKAPGEFRIVVLGDSFTVSAGVRFDQIYTTRLQAALRQVLPRARVVNLAVGGYNIVQYELALREVGLALEPDLLLVALFPDNDFGMGNYEENRRVASGEEDDAEPPAWQRSYVYRAFGRRLEAKLQGLFPREEPGAAARSQEAWRRNVEALQAIAGVARERRIPLEVAVLPHTWNFERQRPLFARVEALCRGQGLSCLSLLEPFIARGLDEASLRLNLLDAHPNARYNAVVAEELAAYLVPRLPRGSRNSPNGLVAFDDARRSASYLCAL